MALRPVVFGLCTALACATGQPDPRGRGSDVDGGDKPDLPDAGSPDAFVIEGQPDAAVIEPDDAGQPDGACLAQPTELLVNGDFEAGPGEPWDQVSAGGFELIVEAGDGQLPFEVVPDSGTFVAYLGGYDNATDSIAQERTLPPDASDVRLRGAVMVDTEETVAQDFDHVFIELTSVEGELVAELAHLTNQDATDRQFVPLDIPVAGLLAGRTVRVQVRATGDLDLDTHFFVDTLRFEATTCETE